VGADEFAHVAGFLGGADMARVGATCLDGRRAGAAYADDWYRPAGRASVSDRLRVVQRGSRYQNIRFLRTFCDRIVAGGLALDGEGNVLVTNIMACSVCVYNKSGVFQRSFGSPSAGDAPQLRRPCGVAVDGDGSVFVADPWSHRVSVYRPDYSFLRSFGSRGAGDGQLDKPRDVAVDGEGNVLVADTGNHRVSVFKDGAFVRSFGSEGAADGQLNRPWGVAVDGEGNVLVLDWGNRLSRVCMFRPDYSFLRSFGELHSPNAIAVDGEGNVLVTDLRSGVCVFKDGAFLRSFGSHQLDWAHAVAVDDAGTVFASGYRNCKVSMFGV